MYPFNVPFQNYDFVHVIEILLYVSFLFDKEFQLYVVFDKKKRIQYMLVDALLVCIMQQPFYG